MTRDADRAPTSASEAWLAAYDRSRQRLLALVDVDAVMGPPVSACPGWDVVDVIRHLGGLAIDVADGRVEGLAGAATNDSQIAARAHLPAGAVFEEWSSAWPRLASSCTDTALNERSFAPLPVVALYDLASHEQDIRTALGVARFADDEALRLCLGAAMDLLLTRIEGAGLPVLQVDAGVAGRWTCDAGGPVVRLDAEPFELWRSLSGRRTREQVRSYAWSGDPTQYLDHWVDHPFAWPTAPVGD